MHKLKMHAINRNQAIDALKGVGIIFVIMGHMDPSPIGNGMIAYIYSFHIPLFFWATGYLLYEKKKESLASVFWSKLKSIYLPYGLFFVTSIFFGHIFVRHILGQYVIPFDALETVRAFFYSSEWLNNVPTFNFALWFLPLMLVSVLVYSLIPKQDIKVLFAFTVASALTVIPFQASLPVRPALHINVLPMAVTFMGLGHLFRYFEDRVVLHPRIANAMLIGALGFGIWFSFNYGGHVARIGNLLYIPAALASIIFYYFVAKDLRASKVLQFLGKNSLTLFGIHGLVAYTYKFTPLAKYFLTSQGLFSFNINLLYNILTTSAICILITLLHENVVRYFPILASFTAKSWRLFNSKM
jgi:acyltransferase